MHAQLGYAGVNCPATQSGACHGANRAPTPTVVPNLESLKRASTLVGNAFEESGTDAVGSHVAVGVVLDLSAFSRCTMNRMTYRYRNADVEPRSMIFQVYAQEIGVDGMANIRRDQEGVRKGLVQEVWAAGRAVKRASERACSIL